MVDSNAVDVGDFLEAPANGPLTEGVYRVVGTPEDALVCLRVTEDGQRANTGELVRVSASDASALEPASEPRPTVIGVLSGIAQGPYWMIRSLLPI
jgi:hypothetical protein